MITITMPTSFVVLIAVLLALDIIKGVLVIIDNRLTRTQMSLTKQQTEERTIQGTGDCEHCSRLFVDCDGR